MENARVPYKICRNKHDGELPDGTLSNIPRFKIWFDCCQQKQKPP